MIYLGDASVEEGVFHESANFAALHRLPAIFIYAKTIFIPVYTALRESPKPARPITELARDTVWNASRVDGN